ncbi:MAG TPA: filamentous hemagglutinin N-terminal domain-containing protein, partial [Rhizomicrobium sp.]|nr:filamentous hemagglutinin N-terminal domain-containing protein [Rhizomicrobium sp.]
MSVKTAKRSAKYLNTSSLNRPLMMLGAATALLAAGPAYALDANTLPQDPNVVGGSASFSQSGSTLNVNQSTNRAVIDWRSFDIGSNAQTNFAQPNAASIAVNRVNQSANPTQIQGGLHANGQVWILNPNGVVFGKTAHVDAAGIVASTANIDVNAFMGGSNTLHMSGADHGSVVNEGSISVGESGLAAFVAPSVRNSGTITAKVGKVTLAAGTSYTLDLAGDNLVEIGLGAGNALVDQSGKIVNAGGTVQLSAKAASDVVDSIINVSGVIDASSVVKDGGTIVLAGDNINTSSTAKLAADAGTNGNGGTITSIANKTGNYAGSFSAKGGSESGDGGQIETSGKTISVSKDVSVDTLAANGKTGNWTLDPDDLTIADGANEGAINPSASTVNNATIVNLLPHTGVTLAANNSITVNGAIDSSAQSNSSVLALNDQDGGGLTVNLNAPITLGTGQSLTGQGTIVNVGAGSLIQNGVDVALDGGATVNVAAGTYADP